MFYLRRPSLAEIQAVLAAQHRLPLSYAEQGRSRVGVAAGYPVNRFRCRVGRGADVYARATLALQRWAMYDLPWTEVYPRGAAVREGQVVAVLVRHFGFWSLNPCRIVYVAQEGQGTAASFSFALGTLPAHSERGEERFRVELDGDEVWFDLLAFAGPRHWLTRVGYPLLRALQRTFARAAAAAVVRAATGHPDAPRRRSGDPVSGAGDRSRPVWGRGTDDDAPR